MLLYLDRLIIGCLRRWWLILVIGAIWCLVQSPDWLISGAVYNLFLKLIGG